jgi:hypothetical protein
VDGEVAAAGSQDAIDLLQLVLIDATKRRPEPEDDVGRRIGRGEAERTWQLHRREARARRDQALDDRATAGIDDQHVTVGDGRQGIDGGDELAGRVERADERRLELYR